MKMRQITSIILVAAICAACSIASLAQDGADQLVRTKSKSGLPIKLIVVKNNAVYRPKLEENVEKPVQPFNFFWQMKPEEGKDGFYRFGTNDGQEVGWIKKEFAEQWKTAFCYEPINPEGNRKFEIKDTSGRTIASLDEVPPAGYQKTALVLDTLDGKPFKPEESKPVNVAVFLGKTDKAAPDVPATVAPLQGAPSPEDIQKKLALEVVFVIDTTGSMMPCINVVKEVVKQTATALAKCTVKDRIRFGLVAYRDKGDEYTSKVFCPLTENFDQFQSCLNDLQVGGGGDEPEEVFCGLRDAVEKAGWKEDNISSKHIFLVGDAPAKGIGKECEGCGEGISGLSLDAIIGLAHSGGSKKDANGGIIETILSGKDIHAIVSQAGAGNPGTPLAKEQFKKLSQNGNPGDRHCYVELDTENDASKDAAIAALDTFVKGIKTIEDVAKGSSAGSTATTTGSTVKTDDVISSAIYKILVECKDPVLTGIASDRNGAGQQVAFKQALVTRNKIKNLISSLNFLYKQLKGKTDVKDRQNVKRLVDDITEALAGSASGTKPDENTNLSDVLQKDFPLKLEVLEITAKRLATMDNDTFQRWLERFKLTCDKVKKLDAVEKNWLPLTLPSDFAKKTGEESEDQFQFIPVNVY